MVEKRVVKRYNTYYQGWRLAFGEHRVVYDERRDINWLFSEDRIGLAVAARLRKRIYRELLGHQEQLPQLVVTEDAVRINDFVYPLSVEADRQGARLLKQFLLEQEVLHMFACSHFCYPAGTHIITFSGKKPTIILYKEMQPLEVILE